MDVAVISAEDRAAHVDGVNPMTPVLLQVLTGTPYNGENRIEQWQSERV